MKKTICLLILAVSVSTLFAEDEAGRKVTYPVKGNTNCRVIGTPKATASDDSSSYIIIEGLVDKMKVVPSDIARNPAVRADVFKSGYFSDFDVLLWACRKKSIRINYHYDDSLGTNVIDDLNGEKYWWFGTRYDGGTRFDDCVYRMDTHLYKDNMSIRVYKAGEKRVNEIYEIFR
jgi:hypothetical protein